MTIAHDRLQRLAALRSEGILTDAEYEAKRAQLVDQILDTPTSAGRNMQHVMVGGLGGSVLGILFICGLLVFVPREKRVDRLFGAWLGTAVGGLTLVLTLGVAVAVAGSSEVASSGPIHTADEVYAFVRTTPGQECSEITRPTLDRSRQYAAERDAGGRVDGNYFDWVFNCRYGERYECYRLSDATLQATFVAEGQTPACAY